MRLIEGYEDAWFEEMFARSAHSGQTRKATGDPYVSHPQAVAKIVDSFGGSDDQVKAALLHDTKEDCEVDYDTIEKISNDKVADIVTELTNDKKAMKKMGKENYMSGKLLELSDDALLIKLADNYHNLTDKPSPEQKERIKANVNVLKRNRKLNKKCAELVASIFQLF